MFRQKNNQFNREDIASKMWLSDYTEDNFIIQPTGEYLDIYEIQSKNVVEQNTIDIIKDIEEFYELLKGYKEDIKLVFLKFPVDVSKNKIYLSNLIHRKYSGIEKTNIENDKLNFIHLREEELTSIEKENTNKEFFIFIFGKNKEDIYFNSESLKNVVPRGMKITRLSSVKKQSLLFKMNNMNLSLSNMNTKIYDAKKYKNDDVLRKFIEKKGYNPYFINTIQPISDIFFEESYIGKAIENGYESVLTVTGLPEKFEGLWMNRLIEFDNTIVTIDLHSLETNFVLKKLKASARENYSKAALARNSSDRNDSAEIFVQQEELRNVIKKGEFIREMIIRIYVRGDTLEEHNSLLSQIQKVTNQLIDLSNYRVNLLPNEQYFEWQSRFMSYTQQQKYLNNFRKGYPITNRGISFGYPFDFSTLQDEYGVFYGMTRQEGVVVYDAFKKDSHRKSYSAVILGKLGSGKSTLVNKILVDRASRGDFARLLDPVGEYKDIVKRLGGKSIALDGTSGIFNPLQVMKTSLNDDGSVDYKTSFTNHLNKVENFYRLLKPKVEQDELNEFQIVLKELYINQGLWSGIEVLPITDYKSEDYPIFSDLLDLVRKKLYSDIEKEIIHDSLKERKKKQEYLENIESTLTALINTNGNIFNGHTTIDNFQNTQIVSFETRGINSLNHNIRMAQMFNIMTLLWNDMLVIGGEMYYKFRRGEVDLETARKFLILVDEAHHLVNANEENKVVVEMFEKILREARKYFTGLYLASQSITDFIPENASSDATARLKTMFSLMEYKWIFEQDQSAVNHLNDIFKNVLSEQELALIPKLEQGQTILVIGSNQTISFDVYVNPIELQWYGGGA